MSDMGCPHLWCQQKVSAIKQFGVGVDSEDVPGTRLCDDGAESCLLV